jgi:hypothetical protein
MVEIFVVVNHNTCEMQDSVYVTNMLMHVLKS